jgi:hypothetical protein
MKENSKCQWRHWPLSSSGGVSQPHFGQVWGWSPTLGKVGGLESSGTPECSELDNKPKTPRIEVFLVSLKSCWNVDIEKGLALAIWTSAAQVMGKRRAGSQIGSLTPDHWKSGINLFPKSELRVQHSVGKILMSVTTLVQTSLRLDFTIESYGHSKFWESNWESSRDSFGTPFRESQQNVPFGCSLGGELQRILQGVRWWLTPESGPWWVLCIQVPVASPNTQGCPEC